MSVNLGHPAGEAHFFQGSIIVSAVREEWMLPQWTISKKPSKGFDCACRSPNNKTGWLRSRMTSLQTMQIGNLSNDNGAGNEIVKNVHI